MSAGNMVTLVGNTTTDVEIRYTQTGTSVGSVGLAVNRRWRNANDEWQEDTDFFSLTIWGDQAHNLQASCPKGTRVIVTGRLDHQTWETDAGEKRSMVKVVVDDIGPALRWASATVIKNEKGTGGFGAPPPSGGYDPGEEPF